MHLDTSSADTCHHHGTPIRHALEHGWIAPGALASIGIRGPWGSPHDADFVRQHDALVASADDVGSRGVSRIVASRPLYVTIDVDDSTPHSLPAREHQCRVGLTIRELFALRSGRHGRRRDRAAASHADLTCHLGAHLWFEVSRCAVHT